MRKSQLIIALLVTAGVSFWLGRVESPEPEQAQITPKESQPTYSTVTPRPAPQRPPVQEPVRAEPVGIYPAPPSQQRGLTYDGYSPTDTTVYRAAPPGNNFRFRPLKEKDRQRIDEQQSPGFPPQPAHRRPEAPPPVDLEALQQQQELQAATAGMGYRFRPKRNEIQDRWTGNYQPQPGGQLMAPVSPWPYQSPNQQPRYPWNPYGPSYQENPRWAASGF